ncbi:Uncharacterised protein [uncultured archaeon]|nr:Uncharacterised protein [uncultured archaeon]
MNAQITQPKIRTGGTFPKIPDYELRESNLEKLLEDGLKLLKDAPRPEIMKTAAREARILERAGDSEGVKLLGKKTLEDLGRLDDASRAEAVGELGKVMEELANAGDWDRIKRLGKMHKSEEAALIVAKFARKKRALDVLEKIFDKRRDPETKACIESLFSSVTVKDVVRLRDAASRDARNWAALGAVVRNGSKDAPEGESARSAARKAFLEAGESDVQKAARSIAESPRKSDLEGLAEMGVYCRKEVALQVVAKLSGALTQGLSKRLSHAGTEGKVLSFSELQMIFRGLNLVFEFRHNRPEKDSSFKPPEPSGLAAEKKAHFWPESEPDEVAQKARDALEKVYGMASEAGVQSNFTWTPQRKTLRGGNKPFFDPSDARESFSDESYIG